MMNKLVNGIKCRLKDGAELAVMAEASMADREYLKMQFESSMQKLLEQADLPPLDFKKDCEDGYHEGVNALFVMWVCGYLLRDKEISNDE